MSCSCLTPRSSRKTHSCFWHPFGKIGHLEVQRSANLCLMCIGHFVWSSQLNFKCTRKLTSLTTIFTDTGSKVQFVSQNCTYHWNTKVGVCIEYHCLYVFHQLPKIKITFRKCHSKYRKSPKNILDLFLWRKWMPSAQFPRVVQFCRKVRWQSGRSLTFSDLTVAVFQNELCRFLGPLWKMSPQNLTFCRERIRGGGQ